MAAQQYDEADLRSLQTSGDLSTKQHLAVITGTTNLITVAGANARYIAGVLIDTPPSGKWGTVLTRGRCAVVAGAAITLNAGGTPLTTDASGRFVETATGEFVQAMAYEAAAGAGEIVEVELGFKGTSA